MATQYLNLFTPSEIVLLRESDEALVAKEKLSINGSLSVSFTLLLPEVLKKRLEDSWGVILHDNKVPMRWIKGDTLPHLDSGTQEFEKTHLVYLTGSSGIFRVGDIDYPITEGAGYVFSEGLYHETIGTGIEPRLLLGPMSEDGLAVGGATTITADGSSDTIYFKYITGSGIYYRINDGGDQTVSLPITIVNSNSSGAVLKVIFETDITVDSEYLYFICGSDHIQFGSTSLNPDGSRPLISIDSVINYPGFIENGTSMADGQDNITIYNLIVAVLNSTTLQEDGGWVARRYFGKGSTDNYIINCHSTGDIPDRAGGIVGADAGNVTVKGCSSSGNINQLAGGIIGAYASQVTCNSCWSTGIIQGFGGGIFGDYAGDNGVAEATECYSEGIISSNGGGIYSRYAGNAGQAIAQKCYSRGNIDTDAGGIFGIGAGSNSGITSATNCYSSGTVPTTANGIYGTGKVNGTETNCYIADGSWSDSTANTSLTGVPTPRVGNIWIVSDPDTPDIPYELKNMGYTPFSTTNITTTPTPELIRTSTATVVAGSSTSGGIISSINYLFIEKSGSDLDTYNAITIDSTTGVISTISQSVAGTYTLWVRNTGSYNITEFELTITESLGGTDSTSPCCTGTLCLGNLNYRGRVEIQSGIGMIGGGCIQVRPYKNYQEMIRLKKTYASISH